MTEHRYWSTELQRWIYPGDLDYEASPLAPRGTVAEIPDEELLRRAVKNARRHTLPKTAHPRWTAVMDAFALGSTYATQLCQRFGLDPNEMVKR